MTVITIAIPTFDRNEILQTTLPGILRQLTPECELLILDNHSEYSVEETVAPLIADFSSQNIRIVRNPINIGGAANLLRCFELCNTEWMWLLGDDDIISPDAIALILRAIQNNGQCYFINFASQGFLRDVSFSTLGLNDLIGRMDEWSHLLFMSVGVYHVPRLINRLAMGYHYCYSRAPHIVLVLSSLGKDGCCHFSKDVIIHEQTLAAAGWEPITVMLGQYTLLELIDDLQVRRIFAEKLSFKPSMMGTSLRLHLAAKQPQYKHTSLYFYDQIVSRGFYYEQWSLKRIRNYVYRFIVKFPNLTHGCIKILYPFIKKKFGRGDSCIEDIRPKNIYTRL